MAVDLVEHRERPIQNTKPDVIDRSPYVALAREKSCKVIDFVSEESRIPIS
jgi:hypothetical protein